MKQLVILGALTFGCGVDNGAPAEGIDLADMSTTHTKGTFTKNAHAIDFEMTRENNVEHFVVSSADGAMLVDARINDDGSHTTQIMGGRLTITVAGLEPPKYSGDQSALAELENLPEADAMTALEPALVANNVERTLLPSKSEHPDPNAEALYEWLPCGAHAGPTQSIDCGSNFLGWTSLLVYNTSTASEGTVIYDGHWDLLYMWPAHVSYGWLVPNLNYDLSGWKWAAHTQINNPGSCPANYPCANGTVYGYPTYNGDYGLWFTH